MVTGSVLTMLAAAVWMDLKSGRIGNRLILFGLSLGLPYQIYLNGAIGFLLFILQVLLPVILFYLMYRIRALGAGDIKLLSLIAVFYTTKEFLCMLPYIFGIGAVIGVLKLLQKGILRKRLRILLLYAGAAFSAGRLLPYERDEKRYWDNRIHFSLPILLGYIGYMIWG